MITGKKVGIELGIRCIGLIIIIVIMTMVSPDANTSKSSSAYSLKGWQVIIINNDSWSGSVNADCTGSTYEVKMIKPLILLIMQWLLLLLFRKKGSNSK